MQVLAAVLEQPNEDLVLRELDLAEPRAGEIRVRVGASGVCHSDLSVQRGAIALPTPIVLGHEGAGVVEATGPGVTEFVEGDHIVLSFAPRCGRCWFCNHGEPHLCELGEKRFSGGLLDGTTRFAMSGTAVNQMAMLGTFAEQIVVPAVSAVALPHDLPLDIGALIGCGVLTGIGSALNTATIAAGDTVAVVGCGGIGLNAIQGARIAGASQVVGVDTVPSKLAAATKFGATVVLDASEHSAVEAIRDATGGRGADVVIECAGTKATIIAAVQMARKGGQVILVGLPSLAEVPSILEHLYYNATTVKICSYGSADVARDVPLIVSLYQSGRLLIDELITERIQLADVNSALADLGSPTSAVRRVITYPAQ